MKRAAASIPSDLALRRRPCPRSPGWRRRSRSRCRARADRAAGGARRSACSPCWAVHRPRRGGSARSGQTAGRPRPGSPRRWLRCPSGSRRSRSSRRSLVSIGREDDTPASRYAPASTERQRPVDPRYKQTATVRGSMTRADDRLTAGAGENLPAPPPFPRRPRAASAPRGARAVRPSWLRRRDDGGHRAGSRRQEALVVRLLRQQGAALRGVHGAGWRGADRRGGCRGGACEHARRGRAHGRRRLL